MYYTVIQTTLHWHYKYILPMRNQKLSHFQLPLDILNKTKQWPENGCCTD